MRVDAAVPKNNPAAMDDCVKMTKNKLAMRGKEKYRKK
jgi:hypothetical protein